MALIAVAAVPVAVAVTTALGTAVAQRTGRATPAQVIGQLSADQLAGQRVVYAYAGLRPPASLLMAIRRGQAGGVILFANNIASVQQTRQVVAALQRASLSSPLNARLLILTDQEGGEVRRLPGGPSLSEKQIGASANPTGLAAKAGTAAARALMSAGVSVNLAPVLDVDRTPGNFIDKAGRSYSSRASVVAASGAAFIAAQQRVGVSASAKHFPGLGAATRAQNTDLRPVTLNLPLTTVRSVDEAPYRPAIAAGVRLVMTSWAVYPALDPRRPAGLSPTVIGSELRGRLGFRGVTITDGIDAGAVTPFGNLATRSVRAAQAGADLILCAATDPAENTPSQGFTVARALAAAIAGGRIGLSSARSSATRILTLRAEG